MCKSGNPRSILRAWGRAVRESGTSRPSPEDILTIGPCACQSLTLSLLTLSQVKQTLSLRFLSPDEPTEASTQCDCHLPVSSVRGFHQGVMQDFNRRNDMGIWLSWRGDGVLPGKTPLWLPPRLPALVLGISLGITGIGLTSVSLLSGCC